MFSSYFAPTYAFNLYGQFNEIGHHGTRIILYNLWFNNNGVLELDFDSDKFVSGSLLSVQYRKLIFLP